MITIDEKQFEECLSEVDRVLTDITFVFEKYKGILTTNMEDLEPSQQERIENLLQKHEEIASLLQ